MFIETVPNRTSPPAILLRESYRDEAGKAQKRTLANLSKLPASLIAGLKGLLKGGVAMPTTAGSASEEGLRIERSLPHGHVAAGLGMLRKIHLDRLLLSTAKDKASRRFCDLTAARSSIRRGSTMSPRTTHASVAMMPRQRTEARQSSPLSSASQLRRIAPQCRGAPAQRRKVGLFRRVRSAPKGDANRVREAGRRLRRFAWPFEQIDWRIGELGGLIEIEERARRRRGFLAPAIRRVDARAYALVVVGQVPSQLGEQNTAGQIAKPKFFIRLAIRKRILHSPALRVSHD